MNQKFYGVSTPALMPDEMDTDMSAAMPHRMRVLLEEEKKNEATRRLLDVVEGWPAHVLPCCHDPLGQHPDRVCECAKCIDPKLPLTATEAELLAMRPGKLTFVESSQVTDQDLIQHSEALEAARKVPGTQPAGARYQSVFGTAGKYTSLENVLHRALEQAATGKGAERHANGLAFENQPMQTISRLVGTHGGLLYQAIKKTQESTRMDTGAAVRELLGAINYLAGAIIYLESPK